MMLSVGLWRKTIEHEHQQLFSAHEYHDPEYNLYKLELISKPLPDLPGVSDRLMPTYDVWHDDGVPFFAQGWSVVIENICGHNNPDEFAAKFDELMAGGGYWRAFTLSRAVVSEQKDTEQDLWNTNKLRSGLATVHAGLREASILPFSYIDTEADEVITYTSMRVKDFLSIHSLAIDLSDDFPGEFDEYLDYADSLHIEMLKRYPDLGEYTHQIWKFFGSDPDSKYKVGMRDRLTNRDEAWRSSASAILSTDIDNMMGKGQLYRAGILASIGRSADLVSAELVTSKFLREYDKTNLLVELPKYLGLMNSVVVDMYASSRLGDIKSFASSFWDSDPNLRDKLEEIIARREIEVCQMMLENPEKYDIGTGMAELLNQQIARKANDLPDEDPAKYQLILKDVDSKIESVMSDMSRASAVVIDRTMESYYYLYVTKKLDKETLAAVLDKMEASFQDIVTQDVVNGDTVERLIGYLSPVCRLGEEAIPAFTSDKFNQTVQQALEKIIGQDSTSPKYKEFYQDLLEHQQQGLYELFKRYWSNHEEYYT